MVEKGRRTGRKEGGIKLQVCEDPMTQEGGDERGQAIKGARGALEGYMLRPRLAGTIERE